MIYHISKKGNDCNNGTESSPFLTIKRAAAIAIAGDRIIVHEGEYREWVKPMRGGNRPDNRITYIAAQGEKVVIKGSEKASVWEQVEGSVYKHIIDNSIFGDYNPYATEIDGDWMIDPKDYRVHTGEVYLCGKSLYEVASIEEVKSAKIKEGVIHSYSGAFLPISDASFTKYCWFAEVDETTTTIYANFHEYDPNSELVEINVRKCCFFPDKIGLDFITVEGFEMAHAATPWAPPTSYQYGMIGVNWSRGWVIKNNTLHDSKCSAVCLGKEGSTGDQEAFNSNEKSGYLFQKESVFSALKMGWNKETVGSHTVKNNTIFNCGQNGIVGHMGCAFSHIEGNHIFNIGTKREFFGWEIAGIKFHAPIDTVIAGNRIHDTTLAIWLDWQAQGTRVSRNLCYNNDCDGNIEVTHGPMMIDNNIFLSDFGFANHAQGTAFINNIIAGCIRNVPIFDRSTPYHFAHSTMVAGTAFVYGGDDRYFNNIFIGKEELADEKSTQGTAGYNAHPPSKEAYMQSLLGRDKGVDHANFMELKQPVYIDSNIYFTTAKPYDKEKNNLCFESFDTKIEIEETDTEVFLSYNLPKVATEYSCKIINTADLVAPRISSSRYEDSNAKTYSLDMDYNGEKRLNNTLPGPFSKMFEKMKIKVW